MGHVLGVFNSACVTWLPKIVPGFRAAFPGIDVQIYQGSYDDITGWLKTGAVELGNRYLLAGAVLAAMGLLVLGGLFAGKYRAIFLATVLLAREESETDN